MPKRLLLALAFLFALPLSAQNAALPVQFCQQGGTQAALSGLLSTNYQQGIIPSCTVTVYLTGTPTLATIYSNNSGTPLSNPFTASATGQFLVFAAVNQGYDVVLSGGISPNTYPSPVPITGVYPSQDFIGAPYLPLTGGNLSGPLYGPLTAQGVANAVPMNKVSLMSLTCNPLQYAINNGSVDATTEIQACITYANQHEDYIEVPPGTFKFTLPLNMGLGLTNNQCLGTWSTRFTGAGEWISTLEPDLSTPGPAIDFGGCGGSGAFAGTSDLQIKDTAGDQSTIAMVFSHGGLNGVNGDTPKVDNTAINMAYGANGASGVIFCQTDLNHVTNVQINTVGNGIPETVGGLARLGLSNATGTGSITGTALVLTNISKGNFYVGQTITGTGVTTGTTITAFVSDVNGIITYTVSTSQTVASTTITGLYGSYDTVGTGSISGNTLTVSSVAYGVYGVGQLVTGAGVASGTTITALGSGAGGVGTYTVSGSPQTVASETMVGPAIFSPFYALDNGSGACTGNNAFTKSDIGMNSNFVAGDAPAVQVDGAGEVFARNDYMTSTGLTNNTTVNAPIEATGSSVQTFRWSGVRTETYAKSGNTPLQPVSGLYVSSSTNGGEMTGAFTSVFGPEVTAPSGLTLDQFSTIASANAPVFDVGALGAGRYSVLGNVGQTIGSIGTTSGTEIDEGALSRATILAAITKVFDTRICGDDAQPCERYNNVFNNPIFDSSGGVISGIPVPVSQGSAGWMNVLTWTPGVTAADRQLTLVIDNGNYPGSNGDGREMLFVKLTSNSAAVGSAHLWAIGGPGIFGQCKVVYSSPSFTIYCLKGAYQISSSYTAYFAPAIASGSNVGDTVTANGTMSTDPGTGSGITIINPQVLAGNSGGAPATWANSVTTYGNVSLAPMPAITGTLLATKDTLEGSCAAATYYYNVQFYNGTSSTSGVGIAGGETNVTLTATGSVIVELSRLGIPAGAQSYVLGVGTSSGTETELFTTPLPVGESSYQDKTCSGSGAMSTTDTTQGGVSIGGSYGTAGQVLTSTGTGTVWGSGSPASYSVTIAPTATSGSGATAVCATGFTCNSGSGTVTLTPGSSATAEGITVTSGTALAAPFNCTVSSTDVATGSAPVSIGLVSGATTTAFTANTGDAASTVQNITYACGGGGGANPLTMNNSGSGAASGTTFNGSAAETISYNTIGASPLAGSTSLTTLGTVTTGTWNATAISPAHGGTGANNSSATGVSQWSSGTQSVSTALANGTTATTQTTGDNTAKIATDAFVLANAGGGAVSSVSNSDGSLTISPTTGAVVASLNMANANTWTAQQTFLNTSASFLVTSPDNPSSSMTYNQVFLTNGLPNPDTQSVTLTYEGLASNSGSTGECWNTLGGQTLCGGSGGTVTSFSATSLSPLFTSSVANPTTTPSLNFTLSNAGAYSLLFNNSASAGAPSYVALSSLPVAQFPTLNQNTTGTAANITATSNSTLTTLSALALPYSQLSGTVPTWNQSTTGTAANVTGIVGIANGGTGTSTPSIVAGSNVTISGSWPNQTISSTSTASTAFSALTGSTNTTAAMLVGTGASLGPTGSGTIVATATPYSGLTGTIPTWNQNTTGTAANLSGTPALPNGTTATTQTTGDNTAKIATDAFVLANAGSGGGAFTLVYNTTSTATGAAISTTTLAAPGSNTFYDVSFMINQTVETAGCTAQPSVGLTITWTDPDTGDPSSVSGYLAADVSSYGTKKWYIDTVTAPWSLNSASNGGVSINIPMRRIYVKGGTSLTFATTYAAGSGCTTAASYAVYPLVVTP